ncbi:MAG: HDOD domain-containing protein, partial [Planctomycetota bacterium]
MPDVLSDANIAAQQVELAMGRLDSLSTLPCVGAQLFSRLKQGRLSPSALADVIESDPALAAKSLSLISRRGVRMPEGRFSLGRALDELPEHEVRDAVLSVKAFQPFDLSDRAEGPAATFGKDLLLHSLAVACCAGDIAAAASPAMDSQLAYFAGLLHDMGKLALREVMPKCHRAEASWRRAYDHRQTFSSKVAVAGCRRARRMAS